MRVGIIGGGIHGVATAYFLQMHGVDDVTVFEKDHLGSGATGYSAGIIRFHYANETHIRITHRSSEIIQNLQEYIGQDGGYNQNGYLVLYPDEKIAKLREIVSRQRSCGLEVDLLESEEIESYLPGIRSETDMVGAYEHEAGFADPYLIATGFANKSRELGTTFKTNTEVTGLKRAGNRIECIETESGDHEVDYVVNAAGQFGAEVGRMAGISIPLDFYESKIAVLTAENEYKLEYPTLSDHTMATEFYSKPEYSGNFIVGGIDRSKVDGRLEGVTEEFLLQVSERLERRLPGYADASVVESWSGVISITPDSNLIIGEPAGLDNFYNIVGGSGHGFKTAPAFAEAAAKQIVGEDVEYNLDQYRLERFDENDLLLGVSSETYGSE